MLKTIRKYTVDAFILGLMLIAVLPMIYWGKDSVLTVWDHLDSLLPWIKMLKDNGLLLAIDSPTNQFGNMSSAYFYAGYYNIVTLFYLVFDVFTAHTALFILKIVTGYVSMLILLRYLFPSPDIRSIIKLVSISYALLPSTPEWWIIFDSAPLLCYLFLIIRDGDPKKINKRVFLLILYPILSEFIMFGFFLMALWALGTIALWIYKKRLNTNLAVGFFGLFTGYIIVDLKAFYMLFILKETLNRSIHGSNKLSLRQALIEAPAKYLVGTAHAPLVSYQVLLPSLFLTLFVVVVFLLYKLAVGKYKAQYKDLARFSLYSLALLGISVCFSLAASAYGADITTNLFNRIFPFLRGFNWGRFSFLNRIVLHICFALTLVTILGIPGKRLMRYGATAIACLQIIAVLSYSGAYGYTYLNLNRDKMIQSNDMLTYREFYAEDLFQNIKTDLDYHGEGVAALGYHPGILMFNGFSCVDGYNNSYPLSRMTAFREVIEPQLEANPAHKKYYDQWGGRMYLYNTDISYEPTRIKADKSVKLLIDTEAFRTLGGVYILSRAEVSNAEDLGLRFIRKYEHDDSVYEIFAYMLS